MAGISLRLVRSPWAPKMTRAHGSPARSIVSPSLSGFSMTGVCVMPGFASLFLLTCKVAPGEKTSLDLPDLAQAPDVALDAGKARPQPGGDNLPGQAGPYHARAQAEHVHVVVLDALMRGVGVMAEAGPYARHLVGHHRGPDAAAAYDDTAPGLAGADGQRHGQGEVRVVAGLLAVRPEIEHDLALLLQELLYQPLERESAMIRAQRHRLSHKLPP